jgi:hypothetical protein|tara:strand:- start:689 stop:1054 length:366 start_codon:yes stop_codon:yes gene_type:complete
MSKVIDKIGRHWQEAIAGGLDKITIKEWDMDIYVKKTYPFSIESRVMKLQSQGEPVEALVETLIVKALDKDGKRIFFDADRINLMNEADPSVILKVVTAINTAELRTKVNDAVKESKPTQS